MFGDRKMAQKEKRKASPPATLIKPDIKQIYATGAFGGFSSHDFRILLYNEKVEGSEEKIKKGAVTAIREVSYELILPPLAAKEFVIWLDKQVKEYERIFGPIKLLPPEPPETKK